MVAPYSRDCFDVNDNKTVHEFTLKLLTTFEKVEMGMKLIAEQPPSRYPHFSISEKTQLDLILLS